MSKKFLVNSHSVVPLPKLNLERYIICPCASCTNRDQHYDNFPKDEFRGKKSNSSPENFKCENKLQGPWTLRRRVKPQGQRTVSSVSPLISALNPNQKKMFFHLDKLNPAMRSYRSTADALYVTKGSSWWSAEVLLLRVSIPSGAHGTMSSNRLEHFLDCKGVDYYSLDTSFMNRASHPETKLVEYITRRIQVLEDRRKRKGLNFMAPQLIIDGVCVGSEIDLYNLEDDGDLDYILSRACCPNCLYPREKNIICYYCNATFVEVANLSVLTENEAYGFSQTSYFHMSRTRMAGLIPRRRNTKSDVLAEEDQFEIYVNKAEAILNYGSVGNVLKKGAIATKMYDVSFVNKKPSFIQMITNLLCFVCGNRKTASGSKPNSMMIGGNSIIVDEDAATGKARHNVAHEETVAKS